MTSSALAADVELPVKAPVAVEAPWWTSGFIEFGGRGFLNNPPYGGHINDPVTGQRINQGSLAKFYEYKTEKPGPFGDFNFATGSGNGLYQFEAWGYNPGYSDQRYDAYFTKAGEHYLDFQWDETPHVYSTSASTLYNTNGNALTLINPNFGAQLRTMLGGTFPTSAAFNAANGSVVSAFLNSNLSPTTIAIQRDTAAVNYRWTPTDNWDIKVDYSNMHRSGSQVDSVVFTPSTTAARVDVPKPVDDTTQNFGVNGEYIGTSAWGLPFNAVVGYQGSVYTDDFSNYTVQNPFCVGTSCALTSTAPLAMMSTPPSNSMNAGTGTIGMDLPLNSRYMGTVAYTGMQQNAQFLPFSINPGNLINGAPGNSLSSLPAQSLNGQINTLLVNNVITTQITPDVKTKLAYRYYNYDNQTPQITINDWIIADTVSAKGTTTNYAPVNPLMLGYSKQNGTAEVTWRPVNSVNIGSSYNFERYEFTRFDATSTDENTGKVYADWKPEKWLTFRGSVNYGERRADNYDYLGNFGIFQWPVPRPSATNPTGFPNTTQYSPYYRQFFLDDRNRTQAKLQVDILAFQDLTITPTFKWNDDEYLLQQNQLGLAHDRGTAAGVEMGYAPANNLRFLFSYMNEQRNQLTFGSGTTLAPYTTTPAYTGTQFYAADINDRVNTFVAGVNYAVIPSRLELGLNYTWAFSTNTSPLFFGNGTTPNPQFPEVSTNFQRLDATAKYVIDPDYTRSLGMPGQVALKLRYAWERNSVTNWNNDQMQPYMYNVFPTGSFAYNQFMAWDNPNYNVHMLAGTVSWAW